jgi:Fungal specific transcription factor domain
LHYISAVHSDVYLLWPLFVTGAECVHEEHREIIRQRCKDIQKDSGFYNNISCLELLEKIWAKNPIGIGTAQGHNSYIPPALNNDGNFTSDFVSNLPGRSQSTASMQPIGSPLLGGQAFKWHSVIESEDAGGEYIVV